MLLQDFFRNTLKALTRVGFLNSGLLSLPALCCAGSAVCLPALPQLCHLENNKKSGASSEAGLHYCTCENLVLVEVALDGCSDFGVVTAGTSGVLWSSILLEGALS